MSTLVKCPIPLSRPIRPFSITIFVDLHRSNRSLPCLSIFLVSIDDLPSRPRSFKYLYTTCVWSFSISAPTFSSQSISSAYRAFRSTCSPQWHHPVAEAAGGARVWGTTGSRRNHLTHSGRWLTRVMSRQLLLHVVCIYYSTYLYTHVDIIA